MTKRDNTPVLMQMLTDDSRGQYERLGAFRRLLEKDQGIPAIIALWEYEYLNAFLWDIQDMLEDSARFLHLYQEPVRQKLVTALVAEPVHMQPVAVMLGRAGQRFETITPWFVSLLIDLLNAIPATSHLDDTIRFGIQGIRDAFATIAVVQGEVLLDRAPALKTLAHADQSSPDVRFAAAYALGCLRAETGFLSLPRLDESNITGIVLRLGEQRGADARKLPTVDMDVLQSSLNSDDPAQRGHAALVLAEGGVTTALDFVQHTDPDVRDAAIVGSVLVALRASESDVSAVLQTLAGLLSAELAWPPHGVARAIGLVVQMSPEKPVEDAEVLAPLGTMLGSTSVELRRETAWALGMIGTPAVRDLLAACLDDTDITVATHAALKLVQHEHPAAAAVLVRALDHKWPSLVGPQRFARLTERVWHSEIQQALKQHGSPQERQAATTWWQGRYSSTWSGL